MLITKFFTAIILINTSLGSCNLQTTNNEMNEKLFNDFCQSFAKAICTKDTATFYKLVDKENLTTSMNAWIKGTKELTRDDLFFPFFFVYSPSKIRNQDLVSARVKSNFFDSFKITNNEMMDEFNVRLNLEWVQNLQGAEPQKIVLYLQKRNEWKVIKARWETL